MLRNYIIIAFRNLTRNKLYSFINIAGLAMGISAFILLLEYVSLEKSVNQFHTNIDKMYRLLNQNTKGESWPEQAPGWAEIIKKRVPEIEDYCRFESGTSKGIVKNEAKNISFKESAIGYVEGNFFKFFNFKLINGQPNTIKKPDVVFISENTAKKYFNSENPIGKNLGLYNQFGSHNYTVQGVFQNILENSDIQYDMVFSLETLRNPANLNGNGWARLDQIDSQFIETYFTINKKADYQAVEKKLNLIRDEMDKDRDGTIFKLQPFKETHLAGELGDTLNHTGDVKYVYMAIGIAFLILLIAWFNYINLSTANMMKRANEVGVRKVIGASQQNLILQFLGESILINLIAFCLSIIFIILIQPFFNQIINRNLSILNLGNSTIWIYSLVILVAGSLLSGVYSAFLLSKFKPVETLKGKITKTVGGVLLRKSLVVIQFGISIILVLSTVLINSQLKHMKSKDLGINLNQLLLVSGPDLGKDSTFSSRKNAFWNDIAKQSFVSDYASSGSVPGKFFNFHTAGFTQPGSLKGDETKQYAFSLVGERYFNTYGIKLLAGRNFTKAECEVEWNDNSKVILNETAIANLGFKTPEQAVRTKIKWDERYLDIVGVIKDYNHTSVQNKINPIIFYPQNSSAYMSIRLSNEKLQEKIASLEKIFKVHFPGNPFEYTFIDENFNKAYVAEQQYGSLFSAASLWAILIACLGLFGLATYTVESRTKEIGIRKVLGASIASIVQLLSKDTLILVGIALLIASPIGYYFMQKWLADFPYRIDIKWWHFAISGLLAALVALFSISFQAIKAALMNPVRSLKTE
jgi:putative ABC transport system permease protein